MNDPFFSAVDEAQPVFASKTLELDDAPTLDKYLSQNDFNKNERERNTSHNHEFQNRNFEREQRPSRSSSHRPHNQKNYDSYYNNRDHKPRLPSMLNDIKAPKPRKINPNKPPQSKQLFNVTIPDHYTYAKPYDGV